MIFDDFFENILTKLSIMIPYNIVIHLMVIRQTFSKGG